MTRPNILVVMTDQQKADTLAIYGNTHTQTPAIDSIASSGVVVGGHICNYPACTPARATFHTGRYSHTTRVRANHLHLPEREITLPAVLKSAGYEIALVGKNHVFSDGSLGSQFRDGGLALMDWPRQIDEFEQFTKDLSQTIPLANQKRMFDHWFQADHFGPQGPKFNDLRQFSLRPELWRSHAATAVTPFPPGHTTSAVLGTEAAKFISARKGAEKPWFLWLSFPDPHSPYHVPEPFYSMYDPADVMIPPHDSLESKPERQRIGSRMCGVRGYDERLIREATRTQYAMVSAIDAALSEAIDALEISGQRENTIVLYTTDHGAYVGDHGAWHKGLAFYDCLTRLPLMISWPGTLRPGTSHSGFFEQVDVMPTLLSLAGINIPPGVQGRSMAEPLQGNAPLREMAFSEAGEPGEPVGWDQLPFIPDSPLDDRYFGWDGFQEAWVGRAKMVRNQRWKYVWYANCDEELYDLQDDPDELSNIAGATEHDELKRELKDALLEWTVETEDTLPLHSRNIYLEDLVTGNFPF
ncbi:MAG TPA: sulfatase-like hydrolase/transferase [Actinomycetota bacterium]|nr:sulfatase-like hydrolase/transferase [Actinomycetota bacterium]